MKHILLLFVFAMTFRAQAAADNWPGDGGKSDVVKGWGAMDFQEALQNEKPVCAYIFDPDHKNNVRAKYLEGRDGLANIDVKDLLKEFRCLRIKSDGTDVRGWPKDMLFHSQRAASVVLMSSDGKKVFTFDKRLSNEQIKPAVIASAAQSILKYEESTRELREKQDKLSGTVRKEPAKETADAAPVNNKVPGLPPKEETVPGLKPKEADAKVEAKAAPAKRTVVPTDE